MINRTILIHSGDILDFYNRTKKINPLQSPSDQSNDALTDKLIFKSDINNSVVLEDGLNLIRLSETGETYPQTTCSKYPQCHDLTLKVTITFMVDLIRLYSSSFMKLKKE